MQCAYMPLPFIFSLPFFISIIQRAKFVGKRTSCSVATEPPPAATEEPDMDAPKEIFLKDYKAPDYYFDTVTTCLF